MKVALDTRGISDIRGIGRYVRCLLEGLKNTAPNGATIVEQHRASGVDVIHSPWIDGVQLNPRRPQVVTLHDLTPLKRPGEYLRTGIRFRFRYVAVKRADRVIVPTEAVADDARRLLGLNDDRLRVIHEAADTSFAPASDLEVADVRKRHKLPDEFLIWVGGLKHPDPRKRISELVEAKRELPLVLVGPTGSWTSQLKGENVRLIGEVSDADLRALYTTAHALVLPSDEEGFGLTPVEALSCGCPVACSEVPAVREVLGSRAAFAPLDDLDQLVSLAESLTRPAPAPPNWNWNQAAAATWKVYEELLS